MLTVSTPGGVGMRVQEAAGATTDQRETHGQGAERPGSRADPRCIRTCSETFLLQRGCFRIWSKQEWITSTSGWTRHRVGIADGAGRRNKTGWSGRRDEPAGAVSVGSARWQERPVVGAARW